MTIKLNIKFKCQRIKLKNKMEKIELKITRTEFDTKMKSNCEGRYWKTILIKKINNKKITIKKITIRLNIKIKCQRMKLKNKIK